MQTKREYLVGLGLAKEGRGKFSNAAKAALAEAEAKGVKFADVLANVPAKPKAEKEGKSEPTAPDVRETLYLTPDEYRYPETVYRAVRFSDGKKVEVSLRECCNTCRVSLVNHACEHPTIHGDVQVTIERR